MDSPIKDWLEEVKLTQGEFALACGVDRADVNRVVNGQREMPRKMRNYLCEYAPDILNAHNDYINGRKVATLEKITGEAA